MEGRGVGVEVEIAGVEMGGSRGVDVVVVTN